MVDRLSLLEALVGREGAQALAKAAERIPELDAAMVPRALFSWLTLAATGYAGAVPGIAESHLALAKSESGFSGAVRVADADYEFADVSLLHVSAAVATLVGLEKHRVDDRVREEDLMRLGKTVDLLVRARVAAAAKMAKAEEPEISFEHERDASVTPPTTTIYAMKGGKELAKIVLVDDKDGARVRSTHIESDDLQLKTKLHDVIKHLTGHELEKGEDEGAEGPGPAHKPTAPGEPLPPTPASRQNQQPPKPRAKKAPLPAKPQVSIPGLSRLKLSEKQLAGQCQTCDGHQVEAGVFVGCYCFRDLGRYVRMQKAENAVTLSFGSEWTEDAVLALLDTVKGGRNG